MIARARTNFILTLCIVLTLLLVGKLFYIQITRNDFYRALAEGQQNWFGELEGQRGNIFSVDRAGDLRALAISSEQTRCFLNTQFYREENSARLLDQVADLLIKERQALDLPVGQDSPKVLLQQICTKDQIAKLRELLGDDLVLENARVRSYPQGQLAAPVVGFLGGEGAGQYGLEGFYDELLRGAIDLVQQE